jgi:hypothetical protein
MPISPDDIEFDRKKRANLYDQWKKYTENLDQAEYKKGAKSEKKIDKTIAKVKGNILNSNQNR